MDVRIRPWHEDDAPALVSAVTASLAELRPWMPWAAGEPRTVEERRRWIREVNEDEAAGGSRTRAILADEVIAGAGALHRRIGPDAWEIGYWVTTGLAGRGVATAAAALLVAEAFADPAVTHVEIHHAAGNAASGAVAARAGFTRVRDGEEWVWRLTAGSRR